MITPTPAPAAGHSDDAEHSPADDAPAPHADCRADTAGGLAFVLAGPPWPGCLLLRRRGTEPADEVLLPLVPDRDGRMAAALDHGAELAEGRWDAYLVGAPPATSPGRRGNPEGAPRRLAPGVPDLRALLGRVPDGADVRVAVRIPYRTKDGFLAVRSWLRAPHAEAGELQVGPATLTVRGTVYGTRLTDRAVLELLGRAAPHPVLRTGATVGGAAFTATVAYAALVAAAPPGIWDLWLRPAGEDGPRVRIARLLDDIADKKPVVVFPARRLPDGSGTGRETGGPVDVRPYYTLDNDLAVRISRPQSA